MKAEVRFLRKFSLMLIAMWVAAMVAACAPQAVPAPTPTKAPAPPAATAAPTKAPEAAPTKAPEPTKPPAPTPTPVTLKFGTSQAVSDAGTFVAMEKGYFKEQGINMEIVVFRTVGERVAPVSTGDLDVTTMPLSAALLNAADRGVEIKIVATSGASLPKFESQAIVLRKDLADSGQVKKPADLKGMKVAIPSLGSSGHQHVLRLLEEAKLGETDVEIVVLPFAEQAAGFANKAIAAASSTEPFRTQAMQQGLAVNWLPLSEAFGGRAQTAVVLFSPGLAKNTDLGRRWMVAYIKGMRDYMDAFTKNRGREEVISILAKHTPLKDLALYDKMGMPYLNPDGAMDKPSMDLQQKFFVDKGFYQGKKTLDDITDLSFVQYAVEKLGKYQ